MDKIIRAVAKSVEALEKNAKCESCKALKDYTDLKNELCKYCGRYQGEHMGACEGCRWYENERNM